MAEIPQPVPSAPDKFSALWPEFVEEVTPSLQELFKLGEADLEALCDNKEGCFPCCVLEYAADACSLVFVSQGLEEKTGYSAERSLGKTLKLLDIKAQGLKNFINERELSYIDEFCQIGYDAIPNASIVTLVLSEREQGDRFWQLMPMQYLTLQARQYIFCVNSVLALPLPTLIREARFLPEAQLDEAQFSCFLDALQTFLEQLRPHIHTQVSEDMGDLQDMVVKSIFSFMKGNTAEFEGDHWVPLIGQDRTYAFQQDVKWAGILDQVQNSLYKIWEVSERHDEVVACAVSDPTGEDCPLVYISREFEKLTGYHREWALGRNCRFLQPNHCWRNAAFNREECLRMRAFCKEPIREHTRIVNLLVNENKNGYPFWNLLVMEHIEVAVNPKTSIGGVDRRYYIFGVQTNLHFQLHRLSELLAMDTRALTELKRLREIFHKQERSLHTQSLDAFAHDCIQIWASEFPAVLELPKIQLVSARRTRASIPIVGLQVSAQNVVQTFPPAMQDGIRHFYLTFPALSQGQVLDTRTCEMEVKLLSLRLAQVLGSLSKTFLHYLRGAITFTLVTPPQVVKHFGEISKALHGQGYVVGSWLLDVHGVDAKHCSISKAVECWQVMSQVWQSEQVHSLGLCGAGKELFEALLLVPDAAPVSAFGVELFPGKAVPDLRYLHRTDYYHKNGITLIAFNLFGPKQAMFERQELKDEAVRNRTDVAMLLIKWCSSQVDAMMIPVTTSGKGRPVRRRSTAGFQISPAILETGQVSQSASGASMMGDEPSKVEANVHRSFIKAFNAMPDIEGLEHLVASTEATGQGRRRTLSIGEQSPRLQGTAGDAAGVRRVSLGGSAGVQILPPVNLGRRPSASSRTSTFTSECDSLRSPTSPRSARLWQRSSTFDATLPMNGPAREGSSRTSSFSLRMDSRASSFSVRADSKASRRTSTVASLLRAAANQAAAIPDPSDTRGAVHQAERASGEEQMTKPLTSLPLAGPRLPADEQLHQALGSSSASSTSAMVPLPPVQGPPAKIFRRPYHGAEGIYRSEAEDAITGTEQTESASVEPSDWQGAEPASSERSSLPSAGAYMTENLTSQSADPAASKCSTWKSTERATGERPTFGSPHAKTLSDVDAWSYNARVAAKLLAKGMDLHDVADALDIEVSEVQMLMSQKRVAGG